MSRTVSSTRAAATSASQPHGDSRTSSATRPGAGRPVPLVAGLYALIGGLVSFSGWPLDVPRLTDWLGSGVSMQPNAAVLIMLAGLAVTLLQFGRYRTVAALGALLALAGSLILAQYIVRTDFGINHQLLFGRNWGQSTTLTRGRVGPPASTSLTLIGISLVILARSARGARQAVRARGLVSLFGIAVCAFMLFSLMGYIFGARQFYTVPWLTAIALQAATMLMALGIAVIGAVPERQPLLLLRQQTSAAALARTILPVLIVLPILVGMLRGAGETLGLYDAGTGWALGMVTLITTTVALMWIALLVLERREQRLTESEARLRQQASELQAIFDTSPIGLAIAESPRGLHIRGNPANERLLGVTAGGELSLRAPQTGYRALRDGQDVPVDDLPMQRACRGETVKGDVLDIARSDGTTVTLYCSAAPLLDERSRPCGAVGAFMDLTPLRRAEAAVRQSEALLSAVLRQLPVGLGVLDTNGQWMVTNELMDRFVPHAVPSTLPERAGRWRAYDAEGRPIPPENWPGQRALQGEIVSPGLEMVFTDEDRRERWMRVSAAPLRNDSGQIIGATAVVQDIDPIKRAQDKLAEQAQVLDIVNDGIYAMDKALRIMSWNDGAQRMFGYTEAEALGKKAHELLCSPISPEQRAAFVQRTLGGEVLRLETELRRKDGSPIWVDVTALAQRTSEGRFARFVAIIRDITERKRAEQERAQLLESERAARTEAEQAGRVKDEFLATLSHELRTPLNAILGWSRLIDRNPGDAKTVSDGIRVITRNAKAQADLIADLLDMSRIISGKLRLDVEDVDLPKVVAAAIDAVRHSAEAKRIRIESIHDLVFDTVRGDAGRLQQVVWNLLSNAVKFTPEGGRIQVVLAGTDAHAEIVVSDTGMGIKPEFLPHLFERFRQADASAARRYAGLGLGLAIVRHIVELHGGTVRAESPGEGLGATFTVQLPLAIAPVSSEIAAGPRESRHEASRLSLGNDIDLHGIRVLAIDDQADTRDLLGRILEEHRAHVILAASSDEGLQALKDHRPHVVLCDIGMPGKDGYEFIRAVREEGHNTPALAVTALARPENRLRALRAGYQGHISKPLEPAELLATVAVFAKGQQAPDQNAPKRRA